MPMAAIVRALARGGNCGDKLSVPAAAVVAPRGRSLGWRAVKRQKHREYMSERVARTVTGIDLAVAMRFLDEGGIDLVRTPEGWVEADVGAWGMRRQHVVFTLI